MTSKRRSASRPTDELGAEAVVDVHHLRELHATLRYSFALDRREPAFRCGGLDCELAAGIEPGVVEALLA